MSSVVIVAIPAQDERVWQVSSEKVPHMTLLYLGEADQIEDMQRIVDFVEHAASRIAPFWMEMDYRGELGADKADVIFFEKSWEFKIVERFRNQLLQNAAIKVAYESVEQYPEFVPHLTLGYPTAPAKDSEDNHRIYSVMFDRIGVWMGDSEGPEFRLKHEEIAPDSSPSVAMTAADAEALLHYGVKGQKWGVRRENQLRKNAAGLRKEADAIEGRSYGVAKLKAKNADAHRKKADSLEGKADKLKAKNLQKEEKAYIKEALSVRTFVDINNAAADHFNSRIGGLNDKHGDFTKKDFGDSSNYSPRYKAYLADAQKLSAQSIDHANSRVAPNASKTLQAKAIAEPNGTFHIIVQRTGEVKHADDGVRINAKFTFDKQKKVIGVTYSLPAMTQGEEFVTDYLEHYGVKGMRWGQRNVDRGTSPTPGGIKGRVEAAKAKNAAARAEAMAPKPVTVKTGLSPKGKTTIKTEGGKNQPAHPDAIAAATKKQQLHTSGLNSLSNKDLQELATRLNLEQQINRLEPQKLSRGQKFAKKLLSPGNSLKEVDKAANTAVGKEVVTLAKSKAVKKAAAKVAVTAALAAA